MKKIFSLTLFAMIISIATYAQVYPITGPTSMCLGSTVTLNDSATGGTWASSSPTVCTIGVSSGVVYGVNPGTSVITYYGGGSSATMTLTVYPAAPAAITGTTSVCAGASTNLTDPTAGGTWSSSNNSIATVSASGAVYGVSNGTAYIYYSTGGTACRASALVTVGTTSVHTITGPSSVCASGGTITLLDSTVGGVWSCSSSVIATVSPSGVVYGVVVGTVTISYSVTGSCGPSYATHTVNVINTTSAGTISGTSSVYAGGASATLHETISGGMWTSSNTSVATIDTVSGVYTGISVGTSIITYTVSGCGGSATATYTITVTPFNGISGHVNFPGAAYHGNVKIWLITYNSATFDLEAIDSTSVYCSSGTSVFYQFLGAATDSYRVKAAVPDSLGITTSYIPTYHTSSFYWNTANVINHTTGTSDINEDINMVAGTPGTGPGFIGGNVTAGANRGTSTTGIPVVGMHIYVLNSTTNALVQSTTTNASGDYSFSNLPLGTYYVFPDSLNYMTTAYSSITLTSGAPTMSAAYFTQHTLSKTITPGTTAVGKVNNIVSSVIAFPNPTNGKLNLQWNETATEKGNVSITDITGREVYKSAINMNEGTGVKQIDLSGLVNGLYMISVKSGTINYNTKIQVQH